MNWSILKERTPLHVETKRRRTAAAASTGNPAGDRGGTTEERDNHVIAK
jgi:hypothetical protein